MSTVLENKPAARSGVVDKLAFFNGGKSIVTKVKTGLNSYKDFKLPVTEQSVANIQEHARVSEMFATAVEEGMRTLKQDGIEKVLMGVTDIHQVRSVCIK